MKPAPQETPISDDVTPRGRDSFCLGWDNLKLQALRRLVPFLATTTSSRMGRAGFISVEDFKFGRGLYVVFAGAGRVTLTSDRRRGSTWIRPTTIMWMVGPERSRLRMCVIGWWEKSWSGLDGWEACCDELECFSVYLWCVFCVSSPSRCPTTNNEQSDSTDDAA